MQEEFVNVILEILSPMSIESKLIARLLGSKNQLDRNLTGIKAINYKYNLCVPTCIML